MSYHNMTCLIFFKFLEKMKLEKILIKKRERKEKIKSIAVGKKEDRKGGTIEKENLYIDL